MGEYVPSSAGKSESQLDDMRPAVPANRVHATRLDWRLKIIHVACVTPFGEDGGIAKIFCEQLGWREILLGDNPRDDHGMHTTIHRS